MEALAPTTEQLRRMRWEKPTTDQKTKRTAWRAKSWYEIDGTDADHRRAGAHLELLCEGATGADVRRDDRGPIEGPPDEPATARYGRQLASAQRAVASPLIWSALIAQVEGTRSFEDVGRLASGYRSRQQATAFGQGLILAGLELLAVHFGFKRPPRRPPD